MGGVIPRSNQQEAGINLTSKPSMNVLGVQFDSKLSWSEQVNKTINKAKKTYHAINLIKKYFNQDELKGLLTSNYFSVLYYNSEIWHLPTLNPQLKQKLLSASANAVKLCLSKLPSNTSYETIQRLAKRATPTQMTTKSLNLINFYFCLKVIDWSRDCLQISMCV